MNAFMMAASTSGDETLRAKAVASIELLKEINGFVNTDLMNPKVPPGQNLYRKEMVGKKPKQPLL